MKNKKPNEIYALQANICAALANPIRLKILDLVSSGETTSSELLKELKIPKANLSQHLAVLKEAGIIKTRKEGLFIYLKIGIPKIKDACAIVTDVLLEKLEQEKKENTRLGKKLG